MALETVGSNPTIHPTNLELRQNFGGVLSINNNLILGCRQAVRHSTLTAAFVGSNPATPAKKDSRKTVFFTSSLLFLHSSLIIVNFYIYWIRTHGSFPLAVPDDSILPYLACRPRRFLTLAESSAGRARDVTCHPSHVECS